MTNLCMYFQVHQPFRLKKYRVFDIGANSDYFDDKKNAEIMNKVARKCYIPTNSIMLELLNKHPEFKIAYSITGTALEQFEKYSPEVLESFQELVATGNVELLSETYYHSLAFLHDKDEFREQVDLHRKAIKRCFGVKPSVFRNTELVYNNELAHMTEKMGYKAILAEGADHVLGWRSPNYVYQPKTTRRMRLLLKNYKLSDDIAFRFSDKNWSGWPLTAEKFAKWIAPIQGETINLFMDYETFGEHQWADTGIFNFLRHLPKAVKEQGISFHTPSEISEAQPKEVLDVHNPVSWADVERDTSAWLGNKMQNAAAERLYSLKREVMRSRDEELVETWRKLTTSDHFYYMCTKWFADGDVHKYFNPYETPYDCFIAFMNILNDVVIRLRIDERRITTNAPQNSWINV